MYVQQHWNVGRPPKITSSAARSSSSRSAAACSDASAPSTLADPPADPSRPGALTAGLNWYRANATPEEELEPTRAFPAVNVLAMGIWSSGDEYLTEEGLIGSGDHVTGPWRYERIERTGHWLQLDAPDGVNKLLLDFLA